MTTPTRKKIPADNRPLTTPASDSIQSHRSQVLDQAKDVLTMEAQAIIEISKRLNGDFERAVELLMACTGKVVVTGMGKSGHIASKIAATLASTGTPAFFVHPAELHHGDFGMLDRNDIVLALSGSGETQELKQALEPLKRLALPIISLTGNLSSTLARYSDVVLDVAVEREACPLNLAPTTSTTAALAMGDALAMVLMNKKGFRVEDFARSHPGGSLGRQLLTVRDIMRTGMEVPTVSLDQSYESVLVEVTAKKLGFTTVLSGAGALVGIITDGDIRRAQVKFGPRTFEKLAADIMSGQPKTISASSLAVEAIKTMEEFSISDLLIVDEEQKPVGIIHLKDLLRAGIV